MHHRAAGIRSVFGWWTAVGLAATVTGGASAQLANPGLEGPFVPVADGGVSGSVATGWSDNTSWASGVGVFYAADGAIRHEGASSQRIEVSAGFVQFVQWIPFEQGRTDASMWMRAAQPTWVSLYLRGTDYAVYAATTVRLTDVWQKVTVSGWTPNDPEGGLFVNTAGTGTIWVDEGSLVSLGAVPPAPLALTPRAAPIPIDYFGLHVNHLYEPPHIPWPSITTGTIRSHDTAPKWAAIEPIPPTNGVRNYDWTTLDAFVEACEARDLRIVYTIYQTPTWASSTSIADPYGVDGGSSPPADLADYAAFVTALATRYQGRIHAYEVWNEPDISFWTGTPTEMAELEALCAAAVHAADPAALVVAPPPSGGGNHLAPLAWYESYVAAGGGQQADVVACHLYSDLAEKDIGKTTAFVSLLESAGLAAKPRWHDETGYGYDGQGDPAAAVRHVAKTLVLNWALGYELLAYYAWSDVSLLGVRQDRSGAWSVLTDPAIAYDQMRSWLVGRSMTSCELDSTGVWRAELVAPQPNGGTLRSVVIWSALDEVLAPLPSGAYRMRTLGGTSISLVGSASIPVDADPVLIEWTCVGDVTADGVVDASDLAQLLGAWASSGAGLAADVNADGVVDGQDLAGLLGAWGVCP